jgi:hypothetical protein
VGKLEFLFALSVQAVQESREVTECLVQGHCDSGPDFTACAMP